MKAVGQIILILAIIFTALFGVGFGLCGVVGLVLTARSPADSGSAIMVVALSLAGIGIAIGAGFFIYQVLWKAFRRGMRDH